MKNDYLNRHAEMADQILDDFLLSPRDKVLHLYLKSYFKSERKYGKRDRKEISDLIYLRIVKQLLGIQKDLTEMYRNPEQIDPEKIANENESKFLAKIRAEELSKGMTLSHIISRILSKSLTYFYAPDIDDEQLGEFDLVDGVPSVPVGMSIGNKLGDTKFIVQDISSQKIWKHIPTVSGSAWDVCSGAGGKAIMLREHYPEVELYCSDIRKRSLYNLLDRFDYMQLKEPHIFIANMMEPKEILPFTAVSNVLADVPCSGSATWHRQPEQALSFDSSSLKEYQKKQFTICANSLQFLEENGMLIYSTCSYFKKENEDVVDLLKEKFSLETIFQGMVDYYADGGDALFLSVLTKA